MVRAGGFETGRTSSTDTEWYSLAASGMFQQMTCSKDEPFSCGNRGHWSSTYWFDGSFTDHH